jgi:hypothetical protein
VPVTFFVILSKLEFSQKVLVKILALNLTRNVQ